MYFSTLSVHLHPVYKWCTTQDIPKYIKCGMYFKVMDYSSTLYTFVHSQYTFTQCTNDVQRKIYQSTLSAECTLR